MVPIEEYKHFILAAVGILTVGLAFLVLRWPQNKHFSFSQHAAAQRFTIYYYILLFSLVLPLLTTFFLGWFVPHFQLPEWFSFFVVLSAATQYSVTLVPEVGGWKTRYHRHVSGLSGILLVPSLFVLLLADTVSSPSRVVTSIALAVMLTVVAISLLHKNQKYMLPLQASYYSAFFSAIVFVTYAT